MISIIICSRHPDISASLRENIKETIGVEYEIIAVDNSNNDYSIFSAYNKGFSQSQFPCLCFLHEDVLFRTKDWGINLVNHLADKKVGIIGVAGGKMMTKIPASWAVGGRCIHIIQHQNNKKSAPTAVKEPLDFTGNRLPVVLLDGVFLSMRKDLFDVVKFDETFAGFHGYDFDISAQAAIAGFSNYVVYDILLEHFSEGNRDASYYNNLTNIHKKWENKLPLFSNDEPDEVRRDIVSIEAKILGKYIRRLARRGFRVSEIIGHATYFANVLNTGAARNELRFIRLKILFERLFNPKKN
ncbi:MAG: glycosyltransferase [Paludibacteraceae bacterium]